MSQQPSTREAEVLARYALRQRVPLWKTILRFCRRKPLGAVGGGIVLLLILVAIFAPYIAPYDPYQIFQDYGLHPPGAQFPLGSDELGRDVLSRIIFGARISLQVGILCVLFGVTTGTFIGIVSAYFGGKLDLIVQRIIDAMMAFPGIILALAIMASLGQSLNNVIIALSITQIPNACRTIRSQALSVKENQYVEAARAIGCRDWRIIFVHILPQCIAPYLIIATVAMAYVIVAEASLSFLGVGTPPPIPSWGGMLTRAAQRYVQTAPWISIFPGLALSLAVFGINLLGDALRDVLDPRLRTR